MHCESYFDEEHPPIIPAFSVFQSEEESQVEQNEGFIEKVGCFMTVLVERY